MSTAEAPPKRTRAAKPKAAPAIDPIDAVGPLVDKTGMDRGLPKAFADFEQEPFKPSEQRYGIKEMLADVDDAAKAAAEPKQPSEQASASEPLSSESPVVELEPKPEEPAFAPELVEQADILGLSQEDFPTPAALQRAVTAMDKRILALGGQAKPAELPPQLPVQQPPPAPPPAPKGDEISALEARLEKDFDPEFAGVVKQFRAHDSARIARLEQAIQAMHAQSAQQTSDRFTQQFDDWIGSSKDAQTILGKGSFGDLGSAAPELKARFEVVQQMNALAEGYRRSGLPVPRVEILARKGLAAAFPEKISELARAQIKAQVRDSRSGQFIAKPTSQPVSRPTGNTRDGAVDAVTQQMREFGATV